MALHRECRRESTLRSSLLSNTLLHRFLLDTSFQTLIFKNMVFLRLCRKCRSRFGSPGLDWERIAALVPLKSCLEDFRATLLWISQSLSDRLYKNFSSVSELHGTRILEKRNRNVRCENNGETAVTLNVWRIIESLPLHHLTCLFRRSVHSAISILPSSFYTVQQKSRKMSVATVSFLWHKSPPGTMNASFYFFLWTRLHWRSDATTALGNTSIDAVHHFLVCVG